jgi:hypothetical protein
MRQVFSNERGINPLQGIARIVAVCGIAGLAVWTIAAVLDPESRGYDNAAGSAYNQAEVDKPAEAHSSLRAVRPLKPEQILYSDPSTR